MYMNAIANIDCEPWIVCLLQSRNEKTVLGIQSRLPKVQLSKNNDL